MTDKVTDKVTSKVTSKTTVTTTQKKGSDPFGSLPFSMYPPMHGDWGPRWALTQRVQWGDKA